MSLESEEEFRKKYPELYVKYEWADKLVSQYPTLFKETHHVGIGKGWEKILSNLCSIIEFHVDNLPEEIRAEIFITQIKEKFGGLRFYMSHETPYIQGAITMAEAISLHTCERCGAPGAVSNIGGWMTCLCDADRKVALKEAEERAKSYQEKVKK